MGTIVMLQGAGLKRKRINWIVISWRMSIRKGAISPGQGLPEKIYEVDPLACPRCGGDMRIIAFIEDYKIIKKILDYLRIYEFGKKRSPPRINTNPDEFDDYIQDEYIDCDHVC